MRHALLLVVAAPVLVSACGGGSTTHATRTETASPPPRLEAARRLSEAAGSVRFTQTTAVRVGSSTVEAHDNGTSSLTGRRAHIYKLVPGNAVPGELIVVGPLTYSNANVQAALADPSVRPWTKLDTRRLSAAQRAGHPDELAHVLAPLYLADGVARPTRVGARSFRGVVDPARVTARLPAALATSVADAVRNDYPAGPFPARFWLDAHGRLARVRVSYSTAQGTPVTVDTTYSGYGAMVDVTPPAPHDVVDVTPG